MLKNDRILVLSPHTDDAELGMGGTLSRLVRLPCDIKAVVFNAPDERLKEECTRAYEILGNVGNSKVDLSILGFKRRFFPRDRQNILQQIWEINQGFKPNMVFTPCTRDHHQDHETVTNEALRIFKSSTIFGYELQWNVIDFLENTFVTLDERDLEIKRKMLECYKSQHGRPYFDWDYQLGVSRSKGITLGGGYAEAFESIRVVLDGI